MAGFLALPDKSAFPILSVASLGLTITGMTVAGTAQDSHLIPSSYTDETPAYHHFDCKGTHYFQKMQTFLVYFKYSLYLCTRKNGNPVAVAA